MSSGGRYWKVLMPPMNIISSLMKQDVFAKLSETKDKAKVLDRLQIKKCKEFLKKTITKEKQKFFAQEFDASCSITELKTMQRSVRPYRRAPAIGAAGRLSESISLMFIRIH